MERGYTLIELVVAIGLIVVMGVAVGALTLGTRPTAASAAGREFDALLGGARDIAASNGAGATIFFSADPDYPGGGADGASVLATVYAGTPGNIQLANVPVLHAHVRLSETDAGAVPFAFVVHASGAIGYRPNFTATTAPAGLESGCPASGAYVFTFANGTDAVTRSVPCAMAVSAPTALLAFAVPPAASPTPAETVTSPPSAVLPIPAQPIACSNGTIADPTLPGVCDPTPTPPPAPTAAPTAVPTSIQATPIPTPYDPATPNTISPRAVVVIEASIVLDMPTCEMVGISCVATGCMHDGGCDSSSIGDIVFETEDGSSWTETYTCGSTSRNYGSLGGNSQWTFTSNCDVKNLPTGTNVFDYRYLNSYEAPRSNPNPNPSYPITECSSNWVSSKPSTATVPSLLHSLTC